MTTRELLRRNRTVLALHLLRPARAAAVPLLRLPALGDRAVVSRPLGVEDWPGEVWALDFTGHGESSRPVGGGYSPEGLMGDADAALARIGPCVVVGWGIGGYVGLLLAGARPALVRGLVIAEGHGLDGAELDPAVVQVVEHPPPPLPVGANGQTDPAIDPSCDPYAWAELHVDARSAPYALGYLERAVAGRPAELAAQPLAVVALAVVAGDRIRPSWLDAVETHPAVLSAAGLGLPPGSDGAARVQAALARLAPR